MIHPKTRLQYIDDNIGYGVFATEFIPKGTITYVKDALELEVTPEEFAKQTEEMQELVDKYSYIDERGVRIVSWDFGKYVNHCCNCNTISTGYGFEIAIRDIHPGEQVTDEYGIFNLEEPMKVQCKYPNCRGVVSKADFDTCCKDWDSRIKPALQEIFSVGQPLLPFLNPDILSEVELYLKDPAQYKSVCTLKYAGETAKSDFPAVESAVAAGK